MRSLLQEVLSGELSLARRAFPMVAQSFLLGEGTLGFGLEGQTFMAKGIMAPDTCRV